jgi:hypothetical protein
MFVGWLVGPAVAWSGTTPVFGPNSDFPDANLVMPFDASSNHNTFFSISNVGSDTVTNTWVFYSEAGDVLAQVARDILSEGGTDIVDPLNVRTRTFDSGSGGFNEGTPQSLAGFRGFVVVTGPDDVDRLIGNFTIANLATGSAFGAGAIGLGAIGTVSQADFLLGTTFNPSTLQDNELIVLAINVPELTSLTRGAPAPVGQPLFNLSIALNNNDADGLLTSGDFEVDGTALFASFEDLFPGEALNTSATISVTGSEGSAFSGNPDFDPDTDTDIGIIGWYGEAVGQFGAAQNLRTR